MGGLAAAIRARGYKLQALRLPLSVRDVAMIRIRTGNLPHFQLWELVHFVFVRRPRFASPEALELDFPALCANSGKLCSFVPWVPNPLWRDRHKHGM